MLKTLQKGALMKIVYTGENPPRSYRKSIFLAGPSPRSPYVKSWRPDALKILKKLKYDGVIFLPEWRNRKKNCHTDYDNQVEWEHKYLDSADVIVFWVPRDLKKLPGFTTNVEFGLYANSGRIVLGTPPRAKNVSYLNFVADKFSIPRFETLEATFKKTLEILGNGALRKAGECDVPLCIWKTSSFRSWYSAQKDASNRLNAARMEWVNLVGPKKDFIFRWAMRVNIFVANEHRDKTNETIVSRTDISSALLVKREPDILKSKLVLVKEFRSPASTGDGFIRELPSGSSYDPLEPPEIVAQKELEEETGFAIDIARLKPLGARQLAGTFSAHKAHAYFAEITGEELKWFAERAGKLKINDADPTGERLYIEIKTAEEILKDNLVDWSNVGMILSALNKK